MDASSIRSASSLPTPSLRNMGSVRFNKNTRREVISNGNEWVDTITPKISQATYSVVANADLADRTFFIANRSCRIRAIQEVHATAGNDSGAVSLQITKESGTTTVGNGTSLLATAFDLKATANTVQAAALVSNADVLFVNAGDRLSVNYTGTLTTLAGVQVTVELEYPGSEFDIAVLHNTNANVVDDCFFVANESYEIVAITESHDAVGTHSSAVALQVVKDTSTNAPGAGTDLLSTAFDLKAAANTVQSGALTATSSALVLAKGDRLSLDYAGTVTAVSGVVVSVTLRPLNKARAAVTVNHKANGDAVDECFFVANRPCQVISVSAVHATAGNDGSAVNLQVVKDTATDAPGAGTNILTNNASAGFDLKATANTVQNGTLTTTDSALLLAKGDRLSLDYAGTLTTLAGVAVTVVVEYIV